MGRSSRRREGWGFARACPGYSQKSQARVARRSARVDVPSVRCASRVPHIRPPPSLSLPPPAPAASSVCPLHARHRPDRRLSPAPMSLPHFAHDRATAMAYYNDGSAIYSGVQHYYPPGPSVSPVEHDDYPAGEASYIPERPHWQAQMSPSSSYTTSVHPSDYSSSSSQSMTYPSAYAAASQRTGLQDPFAASPSSSARTYASPSLSQSSSATTPTLPHLQRVSWAPGQAPASALYIVDPDPDADAEPARAYPQVKTEEEELETGFIFELASDTPPSLATNPLLDSMPEVPLRATQASKEMRRLMGAFRLDPFAMHNGVKSAASQSVPVGIEVGPLREPPVMFEWQAELDCPLVPQSPRWSPDSQMQTYDEEEIKWTPAPSMEGYGDVYNNGDDMDADVAFQPVMTPAQAVDWGVGYSEQQSMVPTSSAYPVQPLSGIFNRSAHASSSQASISRSLPSLPQPQSSIFYRQAQNYSLASPSHALPSPTALASPPLSHSSYAQRSAPDLYYRQHHQPAQPAASSASAAMRVSALMSPAAPTLARRAPLEYPQTHGASDPAAQYASPSPPSFSSGSTAGGGGGGGGARYRGDDSLAWYRRSALALEAYTASACT
ncbi:uncharacterized protein C8Q71DRAFT_849923 [Rhodofomes roseus]|uniref:Uncharacterized protein n=1 Tax=Rhodofomes roseus TaxID=34475 RepID=A0ABQ8K7B4_9APHY|nr:uncharacterized protein C8Q71DRAFT_849923 [Rhodofomes roseus]KAH9833157.1 hypothetical protein C8Q71DRAFT_849923 [Rhodofomes roseus]